MSSFMSNQELEERRSLLRGAATGNVAAQQKLAEEFHVRVFSAPEREKYAAPRMSPNLPSAARRKLIGSSKRRRDTLAIERR